MSGDFQFPYDYHEVEFGPEGTIARRDQVDQVVNAIRQSQPSDIIFISHGWNNTHDDARGLYQNFFRVLKTRADSGQPVNVSGRKFSILGALWPSVAISNQQGTASGQAAPVAASLAPSKPADADIFCSLQTFCAALQIPSSDPLIVELKSLVPGVENFPSRQRRIVEIVRSLLPPETASASLEDASQAFFKIDPLELINRLSKPTFTLPSSQQQIGGAAGLGNLLTGIGGSLVHVMKYASYYMMKTRAGNVGRTGAYQVLREIRDDFPHLKLHLIGHSFGARLVTAATDGPDGKPIILPESLTLLQAAFSHNGFAHFYDGHHDGLFRGIVTSHKVKGPVSITCSKQDTACGIAYPIASRLSGDTAAALGDANDIFGALGRNGAQKTPEAGTVPLQQSPHLYSFQHGRLLNLNGDSVITSHMDICRDEISAMLLQAIAST
ncbi:MAG: hypothetical protein JOY96_08670 [Verrucomicrobia bacterium]|nr:hypothetical protein [Verrucomicrobiota bacterium]